MKHLSILTIAVFITGISIAQTKNPSTNKEVQDKIKQAQQQLDKLTPEQRKMMEQMGMSTNVTDKITIVKKALNEHNAEWLAVPAVVNRSEDASQTYKAKLAERTNYNRFWKFYDKENKSEPLYKYNPAYFKTAAQAPARPQIIVVAFRYVAMPSSLRIINNFTKNVELDVMRKLLE